VGAGLAKKFVFRQIRLKSKPADLETIYHPFLFVCRHLSSAIHNIMPRQPRQLQAGYCYHVTTRCNNREFRLTSTECRNVFLYTIGKAIGKFKFKLYALCIMSNHVHYLLEPVEPEDLPKIMHWLNWYTAMSFNRILNRTGHFWEKRYYSSGFDKKDHKAGVKYSTVYPR
jgi:REP element-mobilizing transposase RayT